MRRAWVEIVIGIIEGTIHHVALHAEGVGRNRSRYEHKRCQELVALHAEGVGRNMLVSTLRAYRDGRPPCGGRG